MGKKKDNLDALRRDDPKENNWELEQGSRIEEQGSRIGETKKKSEAFPVPEGLKEVLSGVKEEDRKAVCDAWLKVDPEIREKTPVLNYSTDGKMFVFIFRTGQRVKVIM